MAEPQSWINCDEDIKLFVAKLIERLKSELRYELVGIYLHGSLAMGSYYRPKSDMDMIVVIEGNVKGDIAKTVGIAIANESTNRPTLGNVELSVITAKVAKQIPIPTPFEFHYSSDWHEKILNNEVDYSEERIDGDLATHLTYVIQRGVCLYGKPISEVFGQVKWEYFMNSVLEDLDWILENKHILETPFYGVLNICRVLQLLSEESKTVHSKDEGGEWGLEHLPDEFHPLIQQVLDVYRSSEKVNENQRKTGGQEWDQTKLLALRDYVRKILRTR
ncbi:aminoglycoside adenylyltransferase domain-containing protein [Bacillus sp. FSL K6-3431]|uniref:aminoglycoside adenylyltransferase domain-containing protein n=1 Tax=Bacillus sp. FSL K6-3431 TaxID=2921500 RepID=UPI0030FB744D